MYVRQPVPPAAKATLHSTQHTSAFVAAGAQPVGVQLLTGRCCRKQLALASWPRKHHDFS